MEYRRFFLFLVGVMTAFTSSNISIGEITVSLAAIAFLFYFVSILPLLKGFGSLSKTYGKYIFAPIGYIVVLFFTNFVYSYGGGQPFIDKSLLLNYLVMPLILVNVRKDANVTKYAFLGMALGGVLLGLCFWLGIGITMRSDRLSIFGANENELGLIGVFSILSITALLLVEDFFHLKKWKWLFLPFLVPPFSLMIASASRVAIVALAVALVALILFLPGSKVKKLIFAVVGGALLIIGNKLLLESDSMIAFRMLELVEDGNMSGREYIWKAFLKEFPGSPIIGYGETGLVEVARKAGQEVMVINGVEYADSIHNVLLEILLKGGILGLLFMVPFFVKVYKASIVALRKSGDILGLLVGIPVLGMILSAQIFSDKSAWLAFAYMAVAGAQAKLKTRTTKK